ncbi:MAG: DUF72 domain-containing protein [Acidimicrobiales bacterium]|nr:DUF72 domain-containing protein [Acidimicrobiales bacterium]
MSAPILRVGCPMWANRDWVGQYLPSDTPSGRELEPYSQVCNAVEGNTTFYAAPESAVVDRWRESTPSDFRFSFKLPREITHDRRLRDTSDLLGRFLDRMEPLGSRLGPFMIQLPATFGPGDLAVLAAFVDAMARGFDWAVEVRHAAFHAGGDAERPLNDLLHDHGINRVLFDSRPVFDGPRQTPAEIDAWEKKPRLPVRAVATANQPIVRFIGQTAFDANPPFWAPWIDRVVRWIEDGRQPIVFLHTPDNVVAPALCRRFHDEVAARTMIAPLCSPPTVAVQQALGSDPDPIWPVPER